MLSCDHRTIFSISNPTNQTTLIKMNAFIVLAAILGAVSAVPYAPLAYGHASYAAPLALGHYAYAAPSSYAFGYKTATYAAAPVAYAAPIVKSYAAPIVAAPVIAKSYAAPALIGGYGLGLGHGLYGKGLY